jgi:hypothetical protein
MHVIPHPLFPFYNPLSVVDSSSNRMYDKKGNDHKSAQPEDAHEQMGLSINPDVFPARRLFSGHAAGD